MRSGQFPPDVGQEVAFAGRSNAGKSSAINALTNRTQLARTSKTPGRTQAINFFGDEDDRLVDLPGYGYAKAPLAVSAAWRRLIQSYIVQRQSLRVMVVVMDVRRPLLELDRSFVATCIAASRCVHVVLTKVDKLSRQAVLQSEATVRSQLVAMQTEHRSPFDDGENQQISLQSLSSLKRIGVEELRETIVAACGSCGVCS